MHISSHWQKMLDGFDGKPEHLRGVARLWPRYTERLHRWFQKPYERMGAAFPRLDRFVSAGLAVAKRQRRAFDLEMLRQSLTLAFCDAHGAMTEDGHYVVIGDGYAALGSILIEAMPNSSVTFINIGPVLSIDREFFERAHPNRHADFIDAIDFETMPKAQLSFDIACMGEINPDIINRYCQLRAERCLYSYSCNRVEKTFPDGTVTRFRDYGWPPMTVVVDELCPWHQTFYSFKPPFKRKFDGPFRHKLLRT